MSTGKRTADHLPPSEQVSNRPRYIPPKFLGVLLQRNPVSSPPYAAPVPVPPHAASEGPSMNDSSPPYVAPVPPYVAPVPPYVAPVPPQVAPIPPQVAPIPPPVAPVPPHVASVPPNVAPVPIPPRAASEGPFNSDDNSLLLGRSLRRAFPDFPTPSSSPSHSPCPSPSHALYPIPESSDEEESDAHHSRIGAPDGNCETSMDATRSHAQASPDTSSLWRNLSQAWKTLPTLGSTPDDSPSPSFEKVMASPSGPHHLRSSGESYVQHIGEPPRTPENQGTEHREGPGTPKRKSPQPNGPNPNPNPKPVTQTIQPTLDVPTTDATPEDPPAPSFEQVKTAPPSSQHPHPSDEPYTPRKRSPDEVKQTIDDVFQTYKAFLDRLKKGSLLSEEFKLGGESSSVFARDLIGMKKDKTDPLANEFSARVSLLSGASGTGKTQTCARLLGKACGFGISCRRSEPGNDPTDPGFRSPSSTQYLAT
ncbi:uncharacterized protein STEHIDRAFT_164071 [Stereum hirsutum FP-91666 SS1]|uniref:Uncharacterized protein n=1 Tax=Stereum hirsutum (strain FP-91666) TaxID=721885 RepID=R7RWA2_STEHR|nr:uncharacterized protein STEHIDRAFT_164071 [Stereum hirsutum FP-91666 SS1]EIM79040.1 hypothetical protein STEHIDRAFT_164071 [Stereum hirsutum FP-91666 SS1]